MFLGFSFLDQLNIEKKFKNECALKYIKIIFKAVVRVWFKNVSEYIVKTFACK